MQQQPERKPPGRELDLDDSLILDALTELEQHDGWIYLVLRLKEAERSAFETLLVAATPAESDRARGRIAAYREIMSFPENMVIRLKEKAKQ